MGIFSRITDIFKANVNDALDNAEDPEKMLKQMVIEMEESINKTTLAVAQAISNEKSLERKLDKAKKEVTNWEEKAKIALTSGREDLAKAALEKRAVAQKNVGDLEPLLVSASSTSVKLREQLNTLKSKLEEARTRQSTLIARSTAAKAQKNIAQSMSGVGSDAFSKFDKFETKVEEMESEATAHEELAGLDSDLDSQFRELETESVDNDLDKLKAEMGIK